jgi:hypothetical protein
MCGAAQVLCVRAVLRAHPATAPCPSRRATCSGVASMATCASANARVPEGVRGEHGRSDFARPSNRRWCSRRVPRTHLRSAQYLFKSACLTDLLQTSPTAACVLYLRASHIHSVLYGFLTRARGLAPSRFPSTGRMAGSTYLAALLPRSLVCGRCPPFLFFFLCGMCHRRRVVRSDTVRSSRHLERDIS